MSTSPYETPDWPASPEHLSTARQFLSKIATKEDNRPILIMPDLDVDGLTSGGIMYRVITRILLKNRNIDVLVRFIPRGVWIGDPTEKTLTDELDPR